MSTLHRFACLFLSTLLLAAPAFAAPLSFLDAVVDPTSYDRVTLHTDASVVLSVQAVADAHPGAGLRLRYTNAGGPVALLSMAGFLTRDFGWNPSVDGALASLAFTNDRYVDGGDDFINTNLVTLSRALLLQDGRYYVAPVFDLGQARLAWYTTAAPTLLASDFVGFDPATGATDAALHPDFSSAGTALRFGFVNRFLLDSLGAPYALNAVFEYDNVGFTLTPQAVPAPAVPLLLAAALLALPAGRRARRSRQA